MRGSPLEGNVTVCMTWKDNQAKEKTYKKKLTYLKVFGQLGCVHFTLFSLSSGQFIYTSLRLISFDMVDSGPIWTT